MFVTVNKRNVVLVSTFFKKKKKREKIWSSCCTQCFMRPWTWVGIILVLFSFHICWSTLGVILVKWKKC